MYGLDEAAKRAGVGRSTLYNYTRAGAVTAERAVQNGTSVLLFSDEAVRAARQEQERRRKRMSLRKKVVRGTYQKTTTQLEAQKGWYCYLPGTGAIHCGSGTLNECLSYRDNPTDPEHQRVKDFIKILRKDAP